MGILVFDCVLVREELYIYGFFWVLIVGVVIVFFRFFVFVIIVISGEEILVGEDN